MVWIFNQISWIDTARFSFLYVYSICIYRLVLGLHERSKRVLTIISYFFQSTGHLTVEFNSLLWVQHNKHIYPQRAKYIRYKTFELQKVHFVPNIQFAFFKYSNYLWKVFEKSINKLHKNFRLHKFRSKMPCHRTTCIFPILIWFFPRIRNTIRPISPSN